MAHLNINIKTVLLICFLVNPAMSEWKICSFNEMCTCNQNEFNIQEIKEINCTEVPLLKLPNFTDSYINQLKIIGNGLEVLEDYSFSNLTSSKIVLDYNNINSIQDKVFFKMNSTLEELSLNFNDLEEIPINALQYLEKLRSLMLYKNQISSAVVNWSNLINTITELSLGGNLIDNLPFTPETSLMNMKVLSSINVADNGLISLVENSLPISLKRLNASGNNINEFPQLLLNYLQELQYLSLSNNFIELIAPHKYEGNIKLEELDLSHNLLESVGEWFERSIKVKKLNLSFNKINSLKKGSLSGLECKKIDLSNNKLSKLDDEVFKSLENSLEYVDLSYNNFIKLPDSLKSLNSLQTLKFDYNNLMKLKSSLSYLKGVRKLTLAGNKISLFPYESLAALNALYNLDLGYNRIADIRKSDFKSWANSLEKLSLQSNSILFIENNTFEHSSRLTELSLSYNNIGSVDNGAFKYLDRSLSKLDISFGLKGFGFPNAFFTLKAIKYLALDNNNINNIPKAIENLENLETLILDFNNIKDLKSMVFNSNSHKLLKDVRLSFNKIQTIEGKTFADLQSLESVSLHDNKLIKLSEYSFSNLSQNLCIHLSNNKIEIIESKSFSNIPKLKKIDLHGNNLMIFDYSIFENVTTDSQPMTLNLSKNKIESLKVPSYQRNPVYISILDLSRNKVSKVPEKIVEIQTSLKFLDLSYNEISSIESEDFYSMIALEYLCLNHNKVVNIKQNSFISLKKLQILKMAHNHIETIQNEQFKDLENLRVLDLSSNSIDNIPSNAFENTKIERLSLSNNRLTFLSSSLINSIKNSLRSIDISYNQIINVESDIFQNLPNIHDLNLCHNKITSNELNVFQNSNSLSNLQLCGNDLGSISEKSFKNFSNLRDLNLAETGLISFPNLTLPTLRSLNVSGNKINNITEDFFTDLPKLKVLNLSSNQLTGLSSMKWIQLQSLKNLDLSHNPIKVLNQACFYGLYSLRVLNLQNLDNIDVIDPDVFKDLLQLTSLKLYLKSSAGINLSRILSSLVKLRELFLIIADDKLTNQLSEKFPKKLHLLEISGKNLKYIDADSLNGLKDFYDFDLRISGTGIKKLPKHILSKFGNRRFKIDLSNNEIPYIGPEILYRTMGETRRFGTKAFPGGLHLEKNPLVCDCSTKWLAQWMRRYLTETLLVNSLTVESRLKMIEDMNQVVCTHSQTKQTFPVLYYDVTFDEVLCVYVLNVPKVTMEKDLGVLLKTNMLLLMTAFLLTFYFH